MEYAKYSYDIREVLSIIENDKNALENLVRNSVAYCKSNNNSKSNWIARELFNDVLSEDDIEEIFDEY